MPEAGSQDIPPTEATSAPAPALDAQALSDAVDNIMKPPPGVYDNAFKAQERLKAEQAEKSAIPPGLLATLENWFSYHPPQDDATRKKYENVRAAGLVFAKVICESAPHGADRTAAIRLVREAVFTTNAAIACDGK